MSHIIPFNQVDLGIVFAAQRRITASPDIETSNKRVVTE